jgi:hypothetical protein
MDQELQNGQTLMTKGGGGTYLAIKIRFRLVLTRSGLMAPGSGILGHAAGQPVHSAVGMKSCAPFR